MRPAKPCNGFESRHSLKFGGWSTRQLRITPTIDLTSEEANANDYQQQECSDLASGAGTGVGASTPTLGIMTLTSKTTPARLGRFVPLTMCPAVALAAMILTAPAAYAIPESTIKSEFLAAGGNYSTWLG